MTRERLRLPGEKPRIVPECRDGLHEVCYIYTTGVASALGSLEPQGLLQRRLFQADQGRGGAAEMDEFGPRALAPREHAKRGQKFDER